MGVPWLAAKCYFYPLLWVTILICFSLPHCFQWGFFYYLLYQHKKIFIPLFQHSVMRGLSFPDILHVHHLKKGLEFGFHWVLLVSCTSHPSPFHNIPHLIIIVPSLLVGLHWYPIWVQVMTTRHSGCCYTGINEEMWYLLEKGYSNIPTNCRKESAQQVSVQCEISDFYITPLLRRLLKIHSNLWWFQLNVVGFSLYHKSFPMFELTVT